MHPDIADIIALTTCTYEGSDNPASDTDKLISLVQWRQGSLPQQHGVRFGGGLTDARAKRVLDQHETEIAGLLQAHGY